MKETDMTQDEWRQNVLSRLSQVERQIQQIEKADAVAAERWTNVNVQLADIQANIKEMRDARASSRQWFERAIGSLLLAAVVTWALNGGLKQ